MLRLISKKHNILGDGIGYVELWDASLCNKNEDNRKKCVAQIATLSYGNKKAKNPEKLWKLLKTRGHYSVFEFVRFPRFINGIPQFYGIEDSLRNNWQLLTYDGFNTIFKTDTDWTKDFKRTVVLLKVKIPIFVARHFVRHRISRLEMSRRYTKPSKVQFEFYCGNSEEFKDIAKYSVALYEKLVNSGVRHELARTVLPQTLYTEEWEMYDWSQLHNFLLLRTHKAAQLETRMYAMAILELIREGYSDILKTIKNFRREVLYDI